LGPDANRHGDGFIVRESIEAGNSARAADAPDCPIPQPFRVKWSADEPEGPTWEKKSRWMVGDNGIMMIGTRLLQ
jgi:hypothetical protein